jgi:hypothetical protein
MGDVEHAPREEALFTEAPTKEQSANSSRYTFARTFSVSTIVLQVPTLMKIKTTIP